VNLAKLRFVFDTNVYISFLLGGRGATKLFLLWRTKKFRLYTSKLQLQEITAVVQKQFQGKARRKIAQQALDDLLLVLQKRAEVIPVKLMGKHSPDKDDDWIIAIALKAKAAYLVSENSKDINQNVLPKNSSTKVIVISEAIELVEGIKINKS
jgi:putative PIN family toxin of toxin-antitoxin system